MENNSNAIRKSKSRIWMVVIAIAIAACLLKVAYSRSHTPIVASFGIENIVLGVEEGFYGVRGGSFDLVWTAGGDSSPFAERYDYLHITVTAIDEEGREFATLMSPKGHYSTGTVDYHSTQGSSHEACPMEISPPERTSSTLLIGRFPYKDGPLYAEGGRINVWFSHAQLGSGSFVVTVNYTHTFFDKTTQSISQAFLVNQNGYIALPDLRLAGEKAARGQIGSSWHAN